MGFGEAVITIERTNEALNRLTDHNLSFTVTAEPRVISLAVLSIFEADRVLILFRISIVVASPLVASP